MPANLGYIMPCCSVKTTAQQKHLQLPRGSRWRLGMTCVSCMMGYDDDGTFDDWWNSC